jgi:hypothetical protein
MTESTATRPRPRAIRPVLYCIAAAALLIGAGCETATVKSQAFAHVDDFVIKLKRGVVTKPDVLLLLGEPDGTGALGGFAKYRDANHAGKGAVDAWYYESITASVSLDLPQDQNVLLVFFLDDRVDGYLWFSNKVTGGLK